MTMYNPAHPGEILRDKIIAPLGLSISETARRLEVSRKTLSNILNSKTAIRPEMAIRLEMFLGQSADLWLKMQAAYDLWQARQKIRELRITPFVPHPSACCS